MYSQVEALLGYTSPPAQSTLFPGTMYLSVQEVLDFAPPQNYHSHIPGTYVDTAFGRGKILRHRLADRMLEVELLMGSILYTPDLFSFKCLLDEVDSPYGRGKAVRYRVEDNVLEVQHAVDGSLSTSMAYMNPLEVHRIREASPSCLDAGSLVDTLYGRATVLSVRPEANIVEVAIPVVGTSNITKAYLNASQVGLVGEKYLPGTRVHTVYGPGVVSRFRDMDSVVEVQVPVVGADHTTSAYLHVDAVQPVRDLVGTKVATQYGFGRVVGYSNAQDMCEVAIPVVGTSNVSTAFLQSSHVTQVSERVNQAVETPYGRGTVIEDRGDMLVVSIPVVGTTNVTTAYLEPFQVQEAGALPVSTRWVNEDVDTPYGRGTVVENRGDIIVVTIPVVGTNNVTTAYLERSQVQLASSLELRLKVDTRVSTPYGNGTVIENRGDIIVVSIPVVGTNNVTTAYLDKSQVQEASSVSERVGEEVSTPYGNGTVIENRGHIIVVSIPVVGTNNVTTAYLDPSQVQGVDVAPVPPPPRAAAPVEVDPKQVDFIYKLALVGDTSTGKSSLIQRYVHKQFEPHSKNTIGVELSSFVLPIRDSLVKLQIWYVD